MRRFDRIMGESLRIPRWPKTAFESKRQWPPIDSEPGVLSRAFRRLGARDFIESWAIDGIACEDRVFDPSTLIGASPPSRCC